MSGLTDETGSLKNSYKPYLTAFREAGYSCEIFRGCILVGVNNKNILIDFDYKAGDWKGLVITVTSPEDAVRIISEL